MVYQVPSVVQTTHTTFIIIEWGNFHIQKQVHLRGLSPHHCCGTWTTCMGPPNENVNIQG